MLLPARNNVYSTLAQTLVTLDTSILLASTAGFPPQGIIVVAGGSDPKVNEVIFYSGVLGSALTGCVRGYDGTTAEAHASGSLCALALVAKHITDLQPRHGTTVDRTVLALSFSINDTGRPFYDTDMDVLFVWVNDRWNMATVSVGAHQVRDFVGDAAVVLPQNYRKGDRWTDITDTVATIRVCKTDTLTHALADWVPVGRQG